MARDGMIATGAVRVQMTLLNAARDLVGIVAWADANEGILASALRQIQNFLPSFDPNGVTLAPDVNEVNRQVYFEGRPVLGTLSELTVGIIDRRIAVIAERLVGMRFGYVCPLHVEDQVAGALTFLFSEPPAEARQRGCEAFARQAALSMENARLRDRVEAERATLQNILGYLADGVIAVHPQRGVVAWNQEAARITGIGSPDMLGRSSAELVSRLEARVETDSVGSFFEHALSGRLANPQRIECVFEGAARRDLRITAFPIGELPGSLVGFTLADVTEYHDFERQQEQFFSIAAHEFRTPLTVLLGYSELLLHRNISEQTQHVWVNHIHQESERLTRILDDFVNVTRLRQGSLSVNLAQLDLASVLTPTIKTIRDTSPDHEIVTHIADHLPLVLADQDWLHQAMFALLDNAVKYSPRHSTVIVNAKAHEGGRKVLISVRDEGIGIEPNDLDRLFTAFQRLERPEIAGIRGSGLGLYIVRGLLDLMNGEIWAESSPGSGSTFFVTIPAAES